MANNEVSEDDWDLGPGPSSSVAVESGAVARASAPATPREGPAAVASTPLPERLGRDAGLFGVLDRLHPGGLCLLELQPAPLAFEQLAVAPARDAVAERVQPGHGWLHHGNLIAVRRVE